MKRKILFLIMALAISVTLAACFGQKDSTELPNTIIVYTNQTSGGRGERLERLVREANFDFEVSFVELAGQNLKNRLIAEKESPMADVVLGGGLIEHIDLKSAGVLREFTPSWLADIDDDYLNEDNSYLPWAIEPLYVVFNKKYFTNNPEEVTINKLLAPTSWKELANDFKGRYNIFKPSSGTGLTFYSSILSKYKDVNGELNINEEGWELLEKVINNGIMDTGLWQYNLTQKQAPIAMTWSGAILEIEEGYGIELDIINFEEGNPVVVSQVAVVDSNHEGRIKAAEIFVEWWGSAETQVKWSEISGQIPANKKAFDLVDEKIKNLNTEKVLDLDWNFISQNTSLWREKIELDLIN